MNCGTGIIDTVFLLYNKFGLAVEGETVSSSKPPVTTVAKDSMSYTGTGTFGDGTVEQVTRYYPFGTPYADPSTILNASLQPYKYNGKELDRMHGLDTYDYGARQYDPVLGRWDRMDPMCEKYYDVSPYAYCLNNPVRFIDKKGKFPGDFFLNVVDAAKDFGVTYNDNSIRDCKEYSSSIIYVRNEEGVLGYTYTIPNIGSFTGSIPSISFGAETAAYIHTHGCSSFTHRDNEFSGIRDHNGNLFSLEERKLQDTDSDIGLSNSNMIDEYVVTPNGSLQKYDPLTGEITILSTNMPSDKTDTERLNNVDSKERHYIFEIDNLRFQDNINKGIYRFKYNF